MSEQLRALYLNQGDQAKLVTSLPDIRFTAESLGESNFSGEKGGDYNNDEISRFIGHLSWKLLSGLNWELRLVLWFIFAIISAALNSKATYTFSPDEWGEGARLSIAFVGSFALVFFADLAIATEIKTSLQKRDADLEKSNLEKLLDESQKEIVKSALVGGEWNAFKRIQGNHLQNSSARRLISCSFLGFYLVMELGSSVARDTFLGQDLGWMVIAAPLLGALLNVMTGCFNGITITYPRSRHAIADRYQERFSQINEKDRLAYNIALMNRLTDIFLRHPDISPTEMSRQKNLLESRDQFDHICTEYQSELKQAGDVHKQAMKDLRAEMHQSISSQSETRSAMNVYEQEYADEVIRMIGRCQDELKKLHQNMEALDLPTGEVDMFNTELEQKKVFHSSEMKRFHQQEAKQRLSERFNEIQESYDSEFRRKRDTHNQSIREIKEEMRQSSTSQPDIQLEMSQRKQEHIEDLVELGSRCKINLQKLVKGVSRG